MTPVDEVQRSRVSVFPQLLLWFLFMISFTVSSRVVFYLHNDGGRECGIQFSTLHSWMNCMNRKMQVKLFLLRLHTRTALIETPVHLKSLRLHESKQTLILNVHLTPLLNGLLATTSICHMCLVLFQLKRHVNFICRLPEEAEAILQFLLHSDINYIISLPTALHIWRLMV